MAVESRADPSPSRLRHLGWALALALALASWRTSPGVSSLLYRLAAAAIVSVATLRPSALRGLYRRTQRLTYPVRWVLSHLALAVIYFGVVTPVALCLRLFGRDALLRRHAACDSHWQDRAPSPEPRTYYQQF